MDTEPFSGVSYYRLKQVDFSGDHSYSSIVAVVNNDDSKQVIIYPNPSTGKFSLNLIGFKTIDAFVEVFDEGGKVIIRKKVHENVSSLVENDLKLASGNYLVVVQVNGEQFTSKLIIH